MGIAKRPYENEPLRSKEMAQRVNALLEDRGWSQSDLMRKARISRSEASRICGGVRNPGCDIVGRVAEVFGVSTDYLIYGGDRNIAEDVAPDIIEFVRKCWTRMDHSDKTLLRVTIGHIQQKLEKAG